jgi:hypothetical protein
MTKPGVWFYLDLLGYIPAKAVDKPCRRDHHIGTHLRILENAP